MACSDTLCQYQSLTNRLRNCPPHSIKIPSQFPHNSLRTPPTIPSTIPSEFQIFDREAFFEIPSKFPPRSPQSHFLQNPSAFPSKIQHTSLTIPTAFHQNSIETPSTSHQHTNKNLSIPANVLHKCRAIPAQVLQHPLKITSIFL